VRDEVNQTENKAIRDSRLLLKAGWTSTVSANLHAECVHRWQSLAYDIKL